MAGGGALSYLTVEPPRALSYGPPPVSSDWISNLPEDFQKGQQYARARNLQTMFQPGTPGAAALQQAGVAPGSLYGLLAGAGGAETVAPFAQRMQQGQIYQQLMGGGQGAGNDIYGAILGQESGNRSNVGDSSAGAVGPGQIMPGTWKEFARPGENIRNPDDNRAVSRRILDKYMQDYNGDAARAAVAYYSGPGNVAPPGAQTPWIRNIQPPKGGPPVSGYVAQVLGRMRTGGTQTAAAATQSDQLNPADRAAVNAMYPPGGQQPAAAVGTSPIAAPDEEAQPAAVEQPPGATGQAPFMAPQGNAAGPANIVKGAAQPEQPTQVAQAAPAAPTGGTLPASSYTTQGAENRARVAVGIRDTVRRQGLAAAGSGLAIPPESMKAQLDQADKLDAQAKEIRDFLAERSKEQFGVGIEQQKKQATSDVEQYAGLHKGLAGAGMTAANSLQYTQAAAGLLNDPQFYSGSLENVDLAWKRALSGLGISPGAALPQEAFRKVMAANILQQVNALKAEAETMGEKGGRIFASQIDLMEKAAQNPDNSVQANRYLTEIAQRSANRTLQLADMADDYKAKHGALDAGFEKQVRNWIVKNPGLQQRRNGQPGTGRRAEGSGSGAGGAIRSAACSAAIFAAKSWHARTLRCQVWSWGRRARAW